MTAPGILLSHPKVAATPKISKVRFEQKSTRDDDVPCFENPSASPLEEETILAKMARLINSNERLIAEMQSLRCRIDGAKAYLSEPGCRIRLGTAYLGHLEARRSATMARLRANRIEARTLLNSLNS